jgi:integrase
MALVMARPWRNPKTGMWHLRQRTPRDLLARVKGHTISLPIGPERASVKVGEIVQVSLRTKDGRKAKELHAVADAALKQLWEIERNGPVPLSSMQVVALAGDWRRSIIEEHQENPGDALGWEESADRTREALQDAVRRGGEEKLAEHLGVDAFLARRGVHLAPESRTAFIREAAAAHIDAARHLERNASGDYRPDRAQAKYPPWVPPGRVPAGSINGAVSVAALFERWATYQADKLAPSTIKRYEASLRSLAAFAQDRDVRSLTSDDLYEWAEHRRNHEGVSARSINKNDLVAVSSVFSWAAGRAAGRLLESNPAKRVHLDEPRLRRNREPTFRADEITAILAAATSVQPDPKNPTFSAALRWCPWLAAYSGARIAELTHLLADDVADEGGVVVLRLRKTKSGEPRVVPVHPHLLEQGFLRFVESVGSGPLFYDPKRHSGSARTSGPELRAQKVAKWVRAAVNLDPEVDPNHAWRHTWKTTALGAGIDDRLRDAITGHSVGVARGYETPTVLMLAEAMRRFPQYRGP